MVYVCVYFSGTRIWTQNLVFARQVVYDLSHTTTFWFCYFEIDPAWNTIPMSAYHLAVMAGACHHAQHFID
jgi:hypothetical protein